MRAISIFDVDRTLTRAPTYSAFLLQSAWRAAPWRLGLVPLIAPWALAYACKAIPRKRMKEIMHGWTLGRGLTRDAAERLATRFAETLVERGLYREGHARILADRATGRRIILATAAPALYIDRFAAMLSIGDVVATRCTWRDDRLTHRIDGDNCYGAAKQRMLEAFLARKGLARGDVHIRFYTDHVSDLPTLDWADEPIAVNPSRRLREIATARGWRMLDWREAGDGPAGRAVTAGQH